MVISTQLLYLLHLFQHTYMYVVVMSLVLQVRPQIETGNWNQASKMSDIFQRHLCLNQIYHPTIF